jgi:glucosyl-dolichyl phosphate glucuronosyltransferase
MSAPGLEADTISVIVCAHTLDRWENLCGAVESIRRQTSPPLETIVVIDGNDQLEHRARSELAGVEVLRNSHDRGLSGGRQSGADRARGTILAFLDDDAIAEQDWLERLTQGYDDPMVLGVGGSIEPVWERPPPRWFPPEFNWVVGCSYPGMPSTAQRVRNVIGANMSMRAAVLAQVGAFDSRLGRAPGAKALSGTAEETELCIRAARAFPGHYWMYEPRARVLHAVPPQRATWRYFARRCVVEGAAKALLSRIAGGDDGLRSERAYVRSVLPAAVLRELGSALRGRPSGLARAAAITAGLTITAAAYARASCALVARSTTRAGGGPPSRVRTGSPPHDAASPDDAQSGESAHSRDDRRPPIDGQPPTAAAAGASERLAP